MIAGICTRKGAATGTGATGAVAAVGTTPVAMVQEQRGKIL
jgi:hypothetical protein